MAFRIFQGNCKEVLKQFPDNHFHGSLSDVPYELGFMGKSWDKSGIELDRDENDQPIGYIDIANARCKWAERQYAESTRQGALDLGVVT